MKLARTFLMLSLAGSLMTACNKGNDKEAIINNWRSYEVHNSFTDKLPDSIKVQLNKGITCDFKKDGRFEMVMDDDRLTGFYSLNDNGTRLICTDDESGKPDTMELISLSKKKMEFMVTNKMMGTIRISMSPR